MRVLHCSDLHVTQRYFARGLFGMGWRRWIAMLEHTVGGRARAYRDARDTVATMVRRLNEHGADHLVVTGDLTAYATAQEFQDVRAALGIDGAHESGARDNRCSIVPGNHDYFTADASAAFETHFRAQLASDCPEHQRDGAYPFVHLRHDDVAIIGLRSARVPLFPGLAYGSIGSAQLAGLDAILADRRLDGRAVLVLVHHAPIRANGRADSLLHGLSDAHALLERLPGPRFAVLHGHVHERYHHPASAHRPHLFGAGSSTRRGDEGYWVIDIEDGVVRGGSVHTPHSGAAR